MKFKVEMIVETFDGDKMNEKEVADEVKEYMDLSTDDESMLGAPSFKKVTRIKAHELNTNDKQEN